MSGEATCAPRHPAGLRGQQPSFSNEGSSLNESRASGDHTKKNKRERRSKDNFNQRNYICGCGKSYLSYAALYTHAKTKHEGVFPEGTTTLHKKKQGRPKKDEWCATKINADYQKVYDFNKEFQHYLEMIPGAAADREEPPKTLNAPFPAELFARSELYLALQADFEQMRSELAEGYGANFLSQIDLIIFEISNAQWLNCTQILALFLIYVFRFVSLSFFFELVFFCVSFRALLNARGWAKFQQSVDGARPPSDQEFCEAQGAEFAPDLSNDFVNEWYASFMSTNKLLAPGASLVFFGTDPICLIRLILLVKHFCHWLSIHKFTRAKIEIKKD